MTTRTLNRTDWQSYFDRLGSTLEGKLTSVEITSTQLGDQWAVRRLPLSGIAYDPRDDLIELDMRGVDHLVRHPQAVTVEVSASGITSMEIVAEDGAREIVHPEANVIERGLGHARALRRIDRLHQVDLDGERSGADAQDVFVDVLARRAVASDALEAQQVHPEPREVRLVARAECDLLHSEDAERTRLAQ